MLLSVQNDVEFGSIDIRHIAETGEGRKEPFEQLDAIVLDEGLRFSPHGHDIAYFH